MNLYPLQFYPILKERIWGGTKLNSVLQKPVVSSTTGESWELSAVPNDVSVVSNGAFKGKSLTTIISDFPEEVLGKAVFEKYGFDFPLLFKFIDAREDLSIQLHPNDVLAKKHHNSLGKTEMWYVMQADEGARLIVGFKEDSNQEEYLQHLEDKNLIVLLQEYAVSKGDVFFLETGTIHAIGAGVLIAEIQQTSDITYRVYDWDRVDAQGNYRELHTDLALEALNYTSHTTKIDYSTTVNVPNKLVHCPYFKTNRIVLDGTVDWKSHEGSFTVFMCTEGEFRFKMNEELYTYSKGDTVLIPAQIEGFEISGKASVLEIYL
ncbi:type I phosphomannose isomerase catalytic subunit [Flavobacterium chuncheonense]|uniref:Phosphohexomutase n=1 Tax=Flavobacterium chuncheonense TaxID=2026653 RepID=A0ABW5YK35_9FLAO